MYTKFDSNHLIFPGVNHLLYYEANVIILEGFFGRRDTWLSAKGTTQGVSYITGMWKWSWDLGAFWMRISFSRGYDKPSFFPFVWETYILSWHPVVSLVHILHAAGSSMCLHVGDSNWHPVRRESIPDGYETTSQFNPPMHLAPFMLWCDIECKI